MNKIKTSQKITKDVRANKSWKTVIDFTKINGKGISVEVLLKNLKDTRK